VSASQSGLKGKRVLVTGGSAGIGLGIARSFAKEQCEIVLAARGAARLEEAAASIRAEYGVVVSQVAVALDERGAAEALAERCGDIDILVNNAGAVPRGSLESVSEAQWRAAWDLKVFGYINLTRLYLPRMKARPSGGVILNVIGAAGEMLDKDYIAGCTGNAALMAFTRAIGSYSILENVRVLGINPGPVETERLQMILRNRAAALWGDEARVPELLSKLPYGRAAHVDEIGAIAVMLASPLCAYMSGTVVSVDGGFSGRR
jgi:3-oxoacyl-[acyl-carrier protein] reductase